MTLPTNKELFQVFFETQALSYAFTEPPDLLRGMREGVAAVRTAIFDALIVECNEGSEGPYNLMEGWYCEGCDTQTPVEDWLRSMKTGE